jgi:hypothetical protein
MKREFSRLRPDDAGGADPMRFADGRNEKFRKSVWIL